LLTPRVVDQHVDATVAFDRGVDQRLHLRRVRHIGCERERPAALAGDLVDQRLEAVDAPRAQHDARA